MCLYVNKPYIKEERNLCFNSLSRLDNLLNETFNRSNINLTQSEDQQELKKQHTRHFFFSLVVDKKKYTLNIFQVYFLRFSLIFLANLIRISNLNQIYIEFQD